MEILHPKQDEIDEALREIGRYFVRFSLLVHRMRFVMAERLTRDGEVLTLASVALASMMAQQIADAFFSMCQYDGDPNDEDSAVANALRTEINEVINERNLFAHGDWWLGLYDDDPTNVAPPMLARVNYKTRKGDFNATAEWTTEDLRARSDRIGELLHDVTEFGYLALGLAVPTRSDDGTGVLESAPREYRVSDVFAFQPGNHKTGVKATFVRKPDTPVLRVHSYVP